MNSYASISTPRWLIQRRVVDAATLLGRALKVVKAGL